MFARDIGIDLGTANVLIHVKGKGIVLNEPSVVAIDRNTGKVLAVGEEARSMVGRTPGNIVAIRPLKDGVIADFEITEAMLKYFINKLDVKSFFSKPRILICCPTNITSVEQKAIREAAERSGGKTVFLEEEPKVAAVGAGMEIFQPSGNMVVDIGGGTTDIAVLSMGDIVTSSSIKMAGDKFDMEILNYIKRKYKLLIGERTSEILKLKLVQYSQVHVAKNLKFADVTWYRFTTYNYSMLRRNYRSIKRKCSCYCTSCKRRTRAHTTRIISGHHRPRCHSNRRWSFTTRH